MTQSGTTEVTSQLPPLSDAAMFLLGAGASFDGGLPLEPRHNSDSPSENSDHIEFRQRSPRRFAMYAVHSSSSTLIVVDLPLTFPTLNAWCQQ